MVRPHVLDLSATSVRQLNATLHDPAAPPAGSRWQVTNPDGRHSLAVGLTRDLDVEMTGHAGYYCAGMNKRARLTGTGNVGVPVVCGDAGEALGDSFHEARIYGAGAVRSLGADCVAKPMGAEHVAESRALLTDAGRMEDTQGAPVTDDERDRARLGLRESATFDRATIHAIQRAAPTGIYDIRGGGAKRTLLKSHVGHREPEDLAALSVEAAAMTRIRLVGTSWVPGR